MSSAGRVRPPPAATARAWVERERLLPPAQTSPARESPPVRKTPALNYVPVHKATKKEVKTKFQKRKEQLVHVLRPPYFILSMILVLVVSFYAMDRHTSSLLEWSPVLWRRQPWRLLTYGVVHASGPHLALNALVALLVGWPLEREQGPARLAALWAAGVYGGALGAGVLQPRVRVVGASAAVYALLTAHIPNVCLRYGHIPLWWFRLLSVVVLSTSETCWGLLRLAHQAPPEQVAWSAHALGALVGLPLGFIFFTGENASRRCVLWCRVTSGVALGGAGAAALVYYAYFSPDYS